jgi:histone-lysine N-methyltransferase EZH2
MIMAKNQTIRVSAPCSFEKDGKRCTRITTVTHPYCARHTREVLGVEVRPSQIRAAGLGLWAVRDFPEGYHLFDYEGERLRTREYDERYADEELGVYGIKLHSRTVIDARRTDAGVARYICTYQGSGKKPNVEYLSTSKTIEMHTSRAICAGEELLGDYGEEMLKALGIPDKA